MVTTVCTGDRANGIITAETWCLVERKFVEVFPRRNKTPVVRSGVCDRVRFDPCQSVERAEGYDCADRAEGK